MVYRLRSRIEICLIGFLLLLFLSDITAQTESSTDNTDRIYRPKLALSFVPTAIFNYTPGIQFGVETATKANQALVFELGYLSHFGGPNQNFNGYRFVGEYRFYNPFKNKPKRYNTYIGLQIHLKQTFLSGTGLFSRANFSYTEILDYRVINTTQNALFVIGESFPLKKKWFLDVAFRAGVRTLHVRHRKVPEDANLINNNDDFFNFIRSNEGRSFYPKVAYSVKLVYLLK